MSNFKHIFKLFLFLSLAFLTGYLYNSFSKLQKKDKKKTSVFFQTNQKDNIKLNKRNEYNQNIKQKQYEVFRNYFIYKKKSGEDISFKNYITLKKDTLIQNNKYTNEKEEIDKKILESFKDNKTENNLSFYYVNGTIKDLNILHKENIEKIVIATFLIKPDLNYNPLVPKKSILPEQEISKKEISCKKDFSFKINSLYENVPTYTVLYAFKKNKTVPSYYGIDEKTFGIPISLLSQREKNEVLKINFKKIKEKESFINLFINDTKGRPLKGIMVTLCGINEISNKFLDYSLFKTVFSNSQGEAKLKSVPYYSDVCIKVQDIQNKYKTLKFSTFTKSSILNIELTLNKKESNKNLSIINNGFFDTINILDSGSDFSQKINTNSAFTITNLKDLPYKNKLLIDFSYKNKTLGLLTKKIDKKETSIIEPRYMFFNFIYGSINNKKEQCFISIENTGKILNKNNFYFSNVSLLKENNNLLVQCKKNKFIINVFLNSLYENIKIDLKIPGEQEIKNIQNNYPSTPNNGLILINKTNSNFFIFGIDSKEKIKAKENSNFFVFNNLSPGNYLIYKIKEKKIKKIKLVKVKESHITLINR
jgi:hypothetical protein